jgi:hypothetical protein
VVIEVQVKTAMKNVDQAGPNNCPMSQKSNPEAPEASRLNQRVEPAKSNQAEAPHTKTWTQQPAAGQRKHTAMCRTR